MDRTRLKRLFLPLVLFFWCNSVSAQPAVDTHEIPPYDYTQTTAMALHGPNGFVFMFGPFERPAPSMGALVYEMILLYVPQFQPIIVPPVEPTYAIDLIMEDRQGVKRLGQRLYFGDAWLSDGRGIAFMKPEDYQRLTSLASRRYKAAEHLDPVRFFADLRRPAEQELPDDWQAGDASAGKAVARMLPSEWELNGHDPGAQLRPRPQGWRSLRRDAAYATPSPPALSAEAAGERPGSSADERQQRQRPALSHDALEGQGPVARERPPTNRSLGAGEARQEDAAEPAAESDNLRRLMLVLLALTIFGLVRLLGRKRWGE